MHNVITVLIAVCIILIAFLQVTQRAVAYDYSQTVVLGDHEHEDFDLGVLSGGSQISYHIEIMNFEIHQGFPDRVFGGFFSISLEDWSRGEDCDSWSGALDHVFHTYWEGERAETYTIGRSLQDPSLYPDMHWCMSVHGDPADSDKKLTVLVEYTITEADEGQEAFLVDYPILLAGILVLVVIVIIFLLIRKGGEEIQN